jgi:hypothetical protein
MATALRSGGATTVTPWFSGTALAGPRRRRQRRFLDSKAQQRRLPDPVVRRRQLLDLEAHRQRLPKYVDRCLRHSKPYTLNILVALACSQLPKYTRTDVFFFLPFAQSNVVKFLFVLHCYPDWILLGILILILGKIWEAQYENQGARYYFKSIASIFLCVK